jgi:hypothetical protein
VVTGLRGPGELEPNPGERSSLLDDRGFLPVAVVDADFDPGDAAVA